MADVKDEETAPASPTWMQTQAPKPLLKSEDRQTPKPRKPRRTKAQMLAAQSNLGAESVIEVVNQKDPVHNGTYIPVDGAVFDMADVESAIDRAFVVYRKRARIETIAGVAISMIAIIIALVR